MIKFTFAISKKHILLTVLLFLIAMVAYVTVGISMFNVWMFSILFFVGINIRIYLMDRLQWIWASLILIIGSCLSTYLIQYILLVADLRARISNEKILINILCCLVFYLVIMIITNHAKLAGIIAHSFLLLFGAINYFVYAFRGNEFTFADIKTVSTGLSVASNYQFHLDAQAVNAVLLTIVAFVWLKHLYLRDQDNTVDFRFQRKWLPRFICLILIIICGIYIGRKTEYTVTETWEQKGTYRNGYVLNFILGIRDSFVEKPEAYSLELIAKLEEEYGEAKEKDNSRVTSLEEGETPTVICIMNESFADLSILGNLTTNESVTPFIDSLTENTVKGYALSSVFGAKTPNSEWEFLTGNSMAWLPSGSVAYQQYVHETNAYSLVNTMKEDGYTTVAMHPYYETGWSRNKVYPILGFDETYFLDDFDQSLLMRKYVSDETLFDQIIDRYESKDEKENLFLMGITMQNHGGYTETYSNFTSDIRSLNAGYTDVNQYLSLIHQTDLAVEKLITYFKEQEEPVIVCFFGDHQPSLNSSFYQRLNGKGLSGLTTKELQELYSVPFFIWTNYETESETIEYTSLNYLSTMIMERANLPLTPYQEFLSDMRAVVPAMNARAYYSLSQGDFIHYSQATGKEAEYLQKYQILQYNGLFDKKNQSEVFFQSEE